MYPLFHRVFVGLSSTTFAITMPLSTDVVLHYHAKQVFLFIIVCLYARKSVLL